MSELPATIGPYQIERELGRGGMGIVYLAVDPRLGRRVAIKLLPSDVAGDADRRARLRREARALASLNHPNVATLHSIDEDDGRLMLVMEHVDGESLGAAIARVRPSINVVIGWCEQIARGMAAAHDAGILHRDLKPANIRIRPDGLVKVLDFGLARAARTSPSSVAETVSSIGLHTVAGGVLGTPGYLAPEQARGEEVDRRADVFSFGCVLFECLAGRPVFRGASNAELLAAVMRDEPEWSLLPQETPTSLRGLLERCLAKDPQQRLRDLADAALELRDALRPPDGDVRRGSAAVRPTPNNLPRELTSLIGREQELARVGELIRTAPLVTLIGSGGCGKTRLALRAARAALSEFPDGVWFVDLSAISDAADVPGLVVRTIGVPAGERVDLPNDERLATALAGSRALVVLDNAEHVLDGVRGVVQMLADRCDAVRLLVTSREPLGLRFEQVYRVPSLSLPDCSLRKPDLASIERSESGRLFLDRARLADPAFTLSPEDAPVVADLCARLDGIALAIELAAARTATMSVRDIDERLSNSLRVLTPSAAGGSVPRHATIRAAIEWSVHMLPPDEAAVFEQLSVFAGGWSLAAAEAVCVAAGDTAAGTARGIDELLARLVSRSLVQPTVNTGRYRLLETVRQFAQERLVISGEEIRARNRHADYFLKIAERSAEATPGSSSPSLAAIDGDSENIHAALAFLERDPASGERFSRLALATYKWWYLHGLFEEATRWLSSAISRRAGSKERLDAALAIGEGTIAWGAGRFRDARTAFERSLGIWEQLNDPARIAGMLSNIAIANDRLGDRAAAKHCHQRAVTLYKQIGDRQGLAFAQLNLSSTLVHEGDLDGALATVRDALPHLEAIGDRHRVGVALHNLGEILTRRGEAGPAVTELRRAIREKKQIGDEHGAVHSTLWLAFALAVAGEGAEAADGLRKLKEAFEQRGLRLAGDERAILSRTCETLARELHDPDLAELASAWP